MNIGNRIKQRRLALGMSVDELACAVDKNRATIYRYEKGEIENLPTTIIEPLAKALETTPEYLMGWTDDPIDYENIPGFYVPREYRDLGMDAEAYYKFKQAEAEDSQRLSCGEDSFLPATNLFLPPKTKKVPLMGTIACGAPILAVENVEEYIDMDADIHATFALRCKGDSMINARIFNGDIVYIRQQPTVENGEIAAVLIGSTETEATLKRVYQDTEKSRLCAENPQYKDMVFFQEEMNEIRILGKAVAFLSTVK